MQPRTRPVDRSEVRVSAEWRILTFPADACDGPSIFGGRQTPIAALWQPLLEQLAAERTAYYASAEWRDVVRSRRAWGITSPMALAPSITGVGFGPGNRCRCRKCERAFYARRGRAETCSDLCRKALLSADRAERAARSRAAARAGRLCETCDEPIAASRSTKRFCSTRCRVAASRARPKRTSP